MIDAVRFVASKEGILLDPVYSGKAFAGLVDSVQTGAIEAGANVLFLMTGGTPSLFSYRNTFRQTDHEV